MWIVIAACAFAASLTAHALLSRCLPQLNRVIAFVGAGCGIGVLQFALLAAKYGALAAQTLSALLIYAFLCELYLFLFTLALSSISANLVVALSREPMSENEIAALYDSKSMVDRRIDRLITNGLLLNGPRGLEQTTKGARLVRSLDSLRVFFRHDAI